MKIQKHETIKFAPVFEGWGFRAVRLDGRETDFVDSNPLFGHIEDAQKYADNNRGNYPYCTTGKVVKVKVTVEVIE